MCWAVNFVPVLLFAGERSPVPNAYETGSAPFELVAEACLCSTVFRWDHKHDYNWQGFSSLLRRCRIFEMTDVLNALTKRKQLPMFWRAVWPWRWKLVDRAWHQGRFETLTRKFIVLHLRNFNFSFFEPDESITCAKYSFCSVTRQRKSCLAALFWMFLKHTHTYTHICTYTYTHTYTHICTHIYTHLHTHTHTYINTHTHIHTHI